MSNVDLVSSISALLTLHDDQQKAAINELAHFPYQREPEWCQPRKVHIESAPKAAWAEPRRVNICRQSVQGSYASPGEVSPHSGNTPKRTSASLHRSVSSFSAQSTCVGGSDISDSCSNPGSDPGSVDPYSASLEWLRNGGSPPATPMSVPPVQPLSLASVIPAPPPGLSLAQEQPQAQAQPKAQAQGQGQGQQGQAQPKSVCTLKIKNLPRRCTQQEVLKAVEDIGFGQDYDFFFLPVGPQSKQNRGYAFMNFRDPATASAFRQAFQGHRIREKAVEVVAAPVQGLTENMMRYKLFVVSV